MPNSAPSPGERRKMMEFLTSPLFAVIATVGVGIGGFYIPGLRALLWSALRSFLSYEVLKRLVIELLRGFVKSTKTTVDDVWLAEFEKDLKRSEK
jgi:hypothetical protein